MTARGLATNLNTRLMSKRDPPRLRQDGDARRTAILEAAIELFAEHGFEGASARAITSRAGANVAAIKYYFGDKIGLYHAALEAAHEELLATTPAPPGPELEPEAALRAFLEHRLRASSRARVSAAPGARLLLRAAMDATTNGEAAELDELLSRAAATMRVEVEELVARLAPSAPREAVSVAAGYFLLVGTRLAEAGPELARFGLRPPQCDAELDEFIEGAWRFLRAGVLALLTQSPR